MRGKPCLTPTRYCSNPLELNGLRLKNRVIMPAMLLNYSQEGRINQRTHDFYLRRAQGGAGLIVAGGCPVSSLAGRPSMISLGPPGRPERLDSSVRSTS